jgi:hypothetical protein
MTAMVENCTFAGPYYPGASFREYVREFLENSSDGDYRATFGMPEMNIYRLRALARMAEQR